MANDHINDYSVNLIHHSKLKRMVTDDGHHGSRLCWLMTPR